MPLDPKNRKYVKHITYIYETYISIFFETIKGGYCVIFLLRKIRAATLLHEFLQL